MMQRTVNLARVRVSSSCLCKKLEGAVLPILVEAAKDRIDDSIDALDIGEDHHGARAPADFHEAALDGIGGAQLLPEVPGKGIEVQELRQVLVQTLHHPGVDLLPGHLNFRKARRASTRLAAW